MNTETPKTDTPEIDVPRAEALAWNAIEDFGPHSPQATAACEAAHAAREAAKNAAG